MTSLGDIFKLKVTGKGFSILCIISLAFAVFQIGLCVFCLKYGVSSKTQNIVYVVLGSINLAAAIASAVLTLISKNETTKGDSSDEEGDGSNKPLKTIIKTVIQMVALFVSFGFLAIYWILFKTAPTKEQLMGEKVMECSKYGCENMMWFGVPSLFFILVYVY